MLKTMCEYVNMVRNAASRVNWSPGAVAAAHPERFIGGVIAVTSPWREAVLGVAGRACDDSPAPDVGPDRFRRGGAALS